MVEPSGSILSHGERDVAGYLREGTTDPATIAEERGVDEESVRKSIDRIEGKTRRALATLEESPFTEEIAAEWGDERREALIEALRAGGG